MLRPREGGGRGPWGLSAPPEGRGGERALGTQCSARGKGGGEPWGLSAPPQVVVVVVVGFLVRFFKKPELQRPPSSSSMK